MTAEAAPSELNQLLLITVVAVVLAGLGMAAIALLSRIRPVPAPQSELARKIWKVIGFFFLLFWVLSGGGIGWESEDHDHRGE